jgi:parallel beta-helix repeat protein
LTFATSALAAGDYQSQFSVKSDTGSSITVTVAVKMVAQTTVAKLAVTCPSNMSVTSSDGSPVAVNYSVTTSGGVAPITVTGTPASGSLFPVGTTSVQVTAKSSDGQTASCGFSVTVTTSSSATAYGPQSTITCPAGAISISPGASIQNVVNSYPGTTTFCIKAGVHYVTGGITPKTGNVFVGEYGATLDGTNWSTTDPNQGAFLAHNQDIDDVTIRNLVIRKMPQRGIHAYYWASDRWTVEYTELTANHTGISVPNNSVVRNNRIHRNSSGGYLAFRSTNVVFEKNEIAYNGNVQKVVSGQGVTFRGNFVHHNVSDGIWYDGGCTDVTIDGNRVEDNGREGIFVEIGARGTIRNNVVSRNKYSGIFISTSKDFQIYQNTLDGNHAGIQYYLNCGAVGGGSIGYDLSNNTASDNSITVGTTSGTFASGLGHLSSCTSTQVAPYLNGSKNLKFTGNRYTVPSTMTKYWLWGLNSLKYWVEWQNLGHDVTGSLNP